MPQAPIYRNGDWNAICDACGKEFKASQLKRRWDGFLVCDKDWETRHPQDFVRGVADTQAPPFTRPEAEDQFALVCTLEGTSSIPELSIPGCMMPSRPYVIMSRPAYSFCPAHSNQCRADIGAADCAVVGDIY